MHVDDVVDVFDVDGVLFDVGIVCGARLEHVGVDDVVVGEVADEWVHGLVGIGIYDAWEVGFGYVCAVRLVCVDGGVLWRGLAADEVWGFGEQVVVQIYDQEFR